MDKLASATKIYLVSRRWWPVIFVGDWKASAKATLEAL